MASPPPLSLLPSHPIGADRGETVLMPQVGEVERDPPNLLSMVLREMNMINFKPRPIPSERKSWL